MTINDGRKSQVVETETGESVLSVLQRTVGFYLDAPCGGNGTCGKCVVNVTGKLSDADSAERALLTPGALSDGARLACRARIVGDCQVLLRPQGEEASSAVDGIPVDRPPLQNDPIVAIRQVSLDSPSLEDQRDSTLRLAQALGVSERNVSLATREKIARVEYSQTLHAITSGKDLLDIRAASNDNIFGIAVDIGTSTVVLYLTDLRSGEVVGTRAALNNQKSFGADVISRIAYASTGPDALRLLQRQIVGQIQQMAEALVETHGDSIAGVVILVAAGNTTMLHLLAGITPEKMAVAPFIPVFTDAVTLRAQDIGFRLHPNAQARLLPSVAAYVGADAVAGIVATSVDLAERPSLLVDLGTNCEVVLGSRDRIVACATAAGPAFEGAHIECGVGGIGGAIRRVWSTDDLHFETIDGKTPVGICGSGILDCVALMLKCGIIDETGRMNAEVGRGKDTEVEPRAALAARLSTDTEGNRIGRFMLAAEEDIYFSQKDVREVQLAKAAIAAGIEVLVDRYGIKAEEIERVYLSGAFGSSMSAESACDIGLFPDVLRDRVEAVGNSAGRGVLLALRSQGALKRCEEVRHRVEYIELSGDSLFRDAYIDHMAFPDDRVEERCSQQGSAR